MRLRIVSWLVRGLPCQFRVIWENRRCSILFQRGYPFHCPQAPGSGAATPPVVVAATVNHKQ
jgi:hypothetical protein